ncbi:MAG: Ig domain-containing protein [Trebonia sp.]
MNPTPQDQITDNRTAKKRWRGTPTLAVTLLVAGMLGATGLAATPALAANGLTVRTASLPAAPEGAVYRAKLAAAGGTGPYTWSISDGTLPAGLTLVPATGLITGIPSLQAPVNDQISVQVSDSETPAVTATANLAIQLQVPPPLALTAISLPTATASVRYSQKLAATGGTEPYTWSIVSGALPAGLTLQPGTGVISGTPKAGGSFRFTAQVSCAAYGKTGPVNDTATEDLSLTVDVAPLAATTVSDLPPAITGVPYSVKLGAAGGITPYTWHLGGGRLPAGLTLHPATGIISGTPTGVGASDFALVVRDSESPPQAVLSDMSITVEPPLAVNSTSLPGGSAGSPYTAQLTASGGAAPYTWSLTDGSQLPAGLALGPDGSITGVISGASGGTATFAVEVTDAEDPPVSATATVSLPIGFNIQG